jgi:hypothetical protein
MLTNDSAISVRFGRLNAYVSGGRSASPDTDAERRCP